MQPEAVAVNVTCVRLLCAAVGGAALTLTDVHDDASSWNAVDALMSNVDVGLLVSLAHTPK